MKVAILTWHYMDNYGGVLQCWALQKVLVDMGCEVEILNYLPHELQGRTAWWRGWNLKSGGFFKNLPKRLIKLFFGKVLERKFDCFRGTKLNLSSPCYTKVQVRALAKTYDAIVVGSDQVWRFPDVSAYFFDFGDPFNGKKISYAACCGSRDDGRYLPVIPFLQSMDSISVRNRFSAEIIANAIGENIPIVADPTMLVDLDQLLETVDNLPEKYILTYIMGAEIDGGHRLVLDAIKKQIGNYPVVAIVATAQCPQFFSFADQRLYHVAPAQWVYLLKNASYIYTDSFHATLYALKNHVQFIAYYAEHNRSARFLDLVERYDVSKYIAFNSEDAVTKISHTPTPEHLDNIDSLICMDVARSLEYLQRALLAVG